MEYGWYCDYCGSNFDKPRQNGASLPVCPVCVSSNITKNKKEKENDLNWYCNACGGKFEEVDADTCGAPKCPSCKSYRVGQSNRSFKNEAIEQAKQEKEKENDMKKVFEYVIHNETEILAEGKILARNDEQARTLIGVKNSTAINFTDEENPVTVAVRPFC